MSRNFVFHAEILMMNYQVVVFSKKTLEPQSKLETILRP